MQPDMKSLATTLVLALTVGLTSASWAQSTPVQGAAYDCTGVNIEDVDPSELTDAERLLLMEQAFYNSIDDYDSCISNVQSDMAASGGGAGGGSGGGADGGQAGSQGNGQGSGQGTGQESSQQSNQQGSEGTGQEQGQNSNQENSQSGAGQENQPAEQNGQQVSGPTTDEDRPKTPTGGGAPKVIPPSDNALAVCKLLYAEIQQEQDEQTKVRLSEEYQRYGCN